MLSAFNLYCCSNKTRLQPVQQRALICRMNGLGLCFPSRLMPPCSYFQLLGMRFGPHAHFFVQKQENGSLSSEKTPAPKSALTPSTFRAKLLFSSVQPANSLQQTLQHHCGASKPRGGMQPATLAVHLHSCFWVPNTLRTSWFSFKTTFPTKPAWHFGWN